MKQMLKSFLVMMGIASLAPHAALAVDVFVVDAKGVDLTPGQVINGEQPLVLAVGQKVTLVTSDGRTIKLKGPTDQPPVGNVVVASNDVVQSLQGLMKAKAADTSSAGIIRDGTANFTQPVPWVVEVRHSGDRCLLAGGTIVLWRNDPVTKPSTIEIAAADKSWSAHAAWPQGSDKLALPATLTLKDGQTYVTTIDKSPVNLAIHVIPQTIQSDAARAAWMIEMGCEPQAKALIAELK